MKDKSVRRERRHKHVLKKIKKGLIDMPRLVVRKTSKNIYVHLVDDINAKVLTGVLKCRRDAALAGLEISEKAKKLGIEKVVFDRAGYKYHGIVKSVADGARKGGLKF